VGCASTSFSRSATTNNRRSKFSKNRRRGKSGPFREPRGLDRAEAGRGPTSGHRRRPSHRLEVVSARSRTDCIAAYRFRAFSGATVACHLGRVASRSSTALISARCAVRCPRVIRERSTGLKRPYSPSAHRQRSGHRNVTAGTDRFGSPPRSHAVDRSAAQRSLRFRCGQVKPSRRL
jgi:hypothetical protein